MDLDTHRENRYEEVRLYAETFATPHTGSTVTSLLNYPGNCLWCFDNTGVYMVMDSGDWIRIKQ